DLASARRWLDWAVEGAWLGTVDDPLNGAVVTRLWSKGGATVDRARAERASWALVGTGLAPAPALTALERCRREAPAEGERLACPQVLAIAASTLHRKEDELAATAALYEQVPGSFTALALRAKALFQAGRFAEVRTLAEAAVTAFPDSPKARTLLES